MPQDLLHVVRRDADAVRRLRREYDARRAAGFDHTWMTAAALAKEASLDGGAAIRTRGFAFDPFRACLGFADSAADSGRRRCSSGHPCDASAPAASESKSPPGRARCERRRSSLPPAPRSRICARSGAISIRSRVYAVVTESLPAAVRRELGRRAAALRDSASPPHFLRWLKDDRAMFAGADQAPVPLRARDKMLLQRSGQLMYELSTIYPAISGARPEWSWDVTHDTTVDGLPYVGLHRNFPRHLFALGHGRHGAAVAWLAARLLLRQFQGAPDKGDELFGFSRILK